MDWLVGWLVGRSVGRWIGLVGRLVVWLVGRSVGGLVSRSVGRLVTNNNQTKCRETTQPSPTFTEHKYRLAVAQRIHHTVIILQYVQRGCSEIALPNLWVPVAIFLVLVFRSTKLITPSNAQFNAWRCTSTSPHLFTVWCLKLLLGITPSLPFLYFCSSFPFRDAPVHLVLLTPVRCVISIRSVCRVRVRFESIR